MIRYRAQDSANSATTALATNRGLRSRMRSSITMRSLFCLCAIAKVKESLPVPPGGSRHPQLRTLADVAGTSPVCQNRL